VDVIALVLEGRRDGQAFAVLEEGGDLAAAGRASVRVDEA